MFSGKRGGFGAYIPFMQLVSADPELELQIVLGDMHASAEFGKTVDEARGYFPNAAIEVIEMGTGRGDTPDIRVENLAACLSKAPAVLRKLNPDVLMVHGDRGEHLMMAFTANNLGIPVAHTQGGETSGNIDDIQRHAITKLAHLHFPETEKAAEKIKSFGEDPKRIFTAGSFYIDRIVKKMYTDPVMTRKKYGLTEKEDFVIILCHPDTYETAEENRSIMAGLLQVVSLFLVKAIVVYPCSDPGYQGIIEAILYERSINENLIVYNNIDNLDFLGLMASAKAIVGNSSSALIEAPYFKLPALNIGNRQRGRDREENVISSDTDMNSIADNFILVRHPERDPIFTDKLSKCGYRLGDGHASEKVLEIIKSTVFNKDFLRK